MKKLIIFILISCFVISGIGVSKLNVYAEDWSSAKAMIVIEPTTKRILYEKNSRKMLPMASTTKIMTALTVFKLCANLDEVVKVSPKAVGIEGTSMYLQKGEEFTVKELLYGMYLPSGNDASVALAIHAAGSEEKFIAEMNLLASKIGTTHTHFANPHGLDEKGHFSTAYDMALIYAKAMEIPEFKEMSVCQGIYVTGKNGQKRYLKNKNKLIYRMNECTGGKIGFTDNAGRCLVASAEKDGMKAVSVVLNCGNWFDESQVLLSNALNSFEMVNLNEKLKTNIEINKAVNTAAVGVTENVFYPVRKDGSDNLEIEFRLKEELTAPLEKDALVGKALIKLNGKTVMEKNIHTLEKVTANVVEESRSAIEDILKNW